MLATSSSSDEFFCLFFSSRLCSNCFLWVLVLVEVWGQNFVGKSCFELLQSGGAQVVWFCAPSPLGAKCSHCSKRWVWTRLTRKHWEALDKSLGFSCCCGFAGGRRTKVGGAYCSPSALHVSALSRPDAVNHERQRKAEGENRLRSRRRKRGTKLPASFTRTLVMHLRPSPILAACLGPVKCTSHEPGGDINNPVCSVILLGGGGGGGETKRLHKRQLSCHILQIPLGCRETVAVTSVTVSSANTVGGATQDPGRYLHSSSKCCSALQGVIFFFLLSS